MPVSEIVTDTTLRISEIFLSLQGESTTVGLPTVFVRLTGCPLRCTYCDTAYAFSGGQRYALSDIIEQVMQYGVQHVTVTGGEPLAQKNCLALLSNLCDQGLSVSLETSGALPIAAVDQRVMVVMDLKTPSSNEVARNDWENLPHLKPSDQIKFVIGDEADYLWAKAQIDQHDLPARCAVLFSPSYEQLKAHILADWIVRDRLPVRFQIQLHKVLWGDLPGV